MKRIKVSKDSPNGKIEIDLAINGRLIAIKGNNNPTSLQFIEQYKKKGAKVTEKRGYVEVDIFNNLKDNLVKLGSIEIDLEEDSDEVIESKLINFYIDMFSKAGFEIK